MKELFELLKKLTDILAGKMEESLKDAKGVQSKINVMIFIVALTALFFNISTCTSVYSNIPIHERVSRPAMAEASSWFYNSGPLEPLPVFALKIPMLFSKADPVKMQRVEGGIVFVLLFFVFIKVLRDRIENASALYGAVIFAGIPWMGYYAMTGSAVLFSMLFLLLYWDYSYPARLDRRRAIYAGICAAAACLCRAESIFFILISTFFFIREYRLSKTWKNVGIMFALMLVLSLPYFAWQKAYYGNAFYGQEIGLTRLINGEKLNIENHSPFVETPTGLFTFLFRDGLVSGIVEPFRGLVRALSFEFPRTVYYKLGMFLAFLGFYFAFVKGKKSIYALWLSAFIPVCFVADMNIVRGQGGIPLEYYLPSLPGVLAAAGYGLQEGCQYIAELIEKKAQEKKGGSR